MGTTTATTRYVADWAAEDGDVWSGKGWRLELSDDAVVVTAGTNAFVVAAEDVGRIQVSRRWFRYRFIQDRRSHATLRGLRRPDALDINEAIQKVRFAREISTAVAWHRSLLGQLGDGRRSQRWIPQEKVEALIAKRPTAGLKARLEKASLLEALPNEEREAVESLESDIASVVRELNDEILAAELKARRGFLDTIEKSPLTEEQATAVICFDNRVQLLAAAGSGKTSVMVARAAYAVDRGFVAPERILALAFNRDAAKELQERIEERFRAAGVDSSGIRASTFHSFGLSVIGQATGSKPRLASWLGQGRETETIVAIADDLRDSSPGFRYRWDLYRTIFGNAPTNLSEHEPDGYDRDSKQTGYRTFGGDIVKSHGERLIANFLYLNGVRYQYERPYVISVANADHSQYRPDFYYPDIDLWHEHWALDRDGNPPKDFKGYSEAMTWKRGVHAANGTRLLETTWAEVMFGDGLNELEAKLTDLGLSLDWDPERETAQWTKPMKHADLARLVRTFMTHVKSNGFTRDDLEMRLKDAEHLRGFRTRLFLDIYWRIHEEWERRLSTEGSVDFEDMLLQAARHIEDGTVDSPYELILVDEFQDASRARARLVKALVDPPGRYLLTVGDDWQAINRFAGADLTVMTEFESWFGEGLKLELTTTFRCPQPICDVASEFVSRNPNQIRKSMRSADPGPGAPVRIVGSDTPAAALAEFLLELSQDVELGRIAPGKNGAVTVDVLGRYGFEKDDMPRDLPENLQVTFRTVHSAKGLEADYVVVPNMKTGIYGFPSNVGDDPVLELAMPAPEDFAHAEERRLFYVALTRARRQVTLITPAHAMSPFVFELVGSDDVELLGTNEDIKVCPQCERGVLVKKRGPHGEFLGCTNFPLCRFTQGL